jgi:hypothetical protein
MTELVRETQSDASPEPLDPAVLQAIRPSATRMAAAEDAFVQLLSEEIGTLVRHRPDHGWQLCERIARTVLWLALSDQSAEAAVQSLYWLGEANQADGFPASEYVTVGHALVRIAREMSGIKWTTTTGSAWIRFFMWLQPYVQAGAGQQVVPRQTAYQEAARQEAARQEAVRQEAVRQEAARQEAARQEAARQQAIRQQAADAHEAAHRAAFDQAIRPTVTDIDAIALASLLAKAEEGEGEGEGGEESEPAPGEPAPGTSDDE